MINTTHLFANTNEKDVILLRSFIATQGVHVHPNTVYELTSGKRSNVYVDIRRIVQNPVGLDLISNIVAGIVEQLDVNALISVLSPGATPITAATVQKLHTRDDSKLYENFIVRKEAKHYGIKHFTKEDMVGLKFLIVDDVSTTGVTIENVMRFVFENQAIVTGVVTIVDRGATNELQKFAGDVKSRENLNIPKDLTIPFINIFKLQQLLSPKVELKEVDPDDD